MLCHRCRCIDFTNSLLTIELDNDAGGWQSLPESLQPTHINNQYHAYAHHSSIEELCRFSYQGCPFCVQIRSELYHVRGHESKEAEHEGPLEVRYYPHRDKITSGTIIREIVVVASTLSRILKLTFNFACFPPLLKSIAHDKFDAASLSTGCVDNMKLACVWLNRCLTQHCFCTASTVTLPPLPSRVLDVDAPDSPHKLSLIDAGGRYSYYVTLSHVWGMQRIITTTTANIDEHRKSIPFEALSRTFKDAITIVRSLNIRYLWIDSLCIIQDDHHDWSREAVKMGSYYLNTLFNIAAVSAPGGHAGCFMPYNPSTIVPSPISIKFPSNVPDSDSPNGTLSGFIRPDMSWDPVSSMDGFHRPKLWQRAWVLQERLLSPRLLLFSEMQMSWLCRTEEASERIPEGTSKFTDLKHGDKVLRSAVLGLKSFGNNELDNSIGTEEELKELYDAWYDLVMLYGKCGLTVKSDIFPAIAGIASAIGQATGDEYYAGHWKSDLHRGLLWTAPDSTLKQCELREYRAPSWSWASLPATCSFWVRQMLQSDTDTSCLELQAAQIKTANNTYGAVHEGRLIVEGVLKKAHPYVSDLEGEEAFASLRDDDARASLFDLDARLVVGYYYADNQNRALLSEVWCAPIMTEASYFRKKSLDGEELAMREARCWAMICLNSEQQIYMRVGLAWVRDADWFGQCQKSTFSII